MVFLWFSFGVQLSSFGNQSNTSKYQNHITLNKTWWISQTHFSKWQWQHYKMSHIDCPHWFVWITVTICATMEVEVISRHVFHSTQTSCGLYVFYFKPSIYQASCWFCWFLVRQNLCGKATSCGQNTLDSKPNQLHQAIFALCLWCLIFAHSSKQQNGVVYQMMFLSYEW